MSRAKDKGTRFENEIARILTEHDLPSERVPGSGSLGGKYDCDVVIGTPEEPKGKIECKHRENIGRHIWDWLKGNDYLAIKKNHKKALIIMDLQKFIKLLKAAEK